MRNEELELRLRAIEVRLREGARREGRLARRADELERERLEDRLRSGGPIGEQLPSGAFGQVPDLASPLLQRLASGAGMDDAGSSELWSKNMLHDPTFESILGGGSKPVGTSWTSVGAEWEARKVIVSGDSPTVTARKTFRRKVMVGQILRSDVIVFDSHWQDGETGQVQVELRPKKHAPTSPHIDWPWVVPAARVYVDNEVRAITNLDEDEANARMLLYDKDNTFIDDGEDVDLDELSADRMEGQPWVGSESVGNGSWMRLQIDLLKTNAAGAGGVAVGIGEPQINYTYQEAPMPYEPIIGNTGNDGTDQPPNDGGWPVDDFERDTDPPTIVVGADWPTGPTRAVADIGVAYDGLTPVPFSLTEDPNPFLLSAVISQIGYPATGFLDHSHPLNDCEGLAFKVTGWQESETWYRSVVPAHPGNMAGAWITLAFGSSTAGPPHGPSYIGAVAGFRAKVLTTAPTGIRQGIHIGSFGAGGVSSGPTQLFVPGYLIPAAGGELWVGVEPAWQATHGFAAPSTTGVCTFRWPYMTGDGNSDWCTVDYSTAHFATWATYTGPAFDMGTILEGGANGTGAWWNGLNRWQDAGFVGNPSFGISGGCFFCLNAINGGKGFTVFGSRESSDPEGPWSGGTGVHEWDFTVDELGMVGEPGLREFWVQKVSEGRTYNARVHFGDPGHAPGVSVSAPFIEDYKELDLVAGAMYTLQIDVRSGVEARVKVFEVGTAPPNIPDVVATIFESGESGDRTTFWLYTGNGIANPPQTARVCDWRYGVAAASGADVHGVLLGYGDGMTSLWHTPQQFRAGSLVLLEDGHHSNKSAEDPEGMTVAATWPADPGMEIRADYVAL